MGYSAVARYYDYTTPFYKLFWHGSTNGIHYGLWESNTKDLPEAILQMNSTLADMIGVRPGMTILDAGCGVGGSSIWLAANKGARVTGITLSPVQKKTAERNARHSGVADLVEFSVQDYTHTAFSDNSFDVVWGLESICYAVDKKDFLKEAYRVLKPGGKIVVADGFLKHLPANQREQEVYRTFLKGFVLDNLAIVPEFEKAMREVGFAAVSAVDVNDRIRRTTEVMDRLVRTWYPIVRGARSLRLVPKLLLEHADTCLAQKEFFETCGTYAIFSATK